MHKSGRPYLVAAVVLTLSFPARPQDETTNPIAPVKNFLTNILGNKSEPEKSSSATAAPAPAPAATKETPDASAAFKVNDEALRELRVDPLCEQVEENFDVWQKAADYGGTAAQKRLQVLVESDFQQSELKESDKKMLRYLAYTTIWVPSSLETGIGQAWAKLSDSGDDTKRGPSGRTQRKAMERLSSSLGEMRVRIDTFPGDAELLLDQDLPDGAFARVGGLVVISSRFLTQMDESDPFRDIIMTHELAHLYKRHTIKSLQYNLISSAAGWQLAKKLLKRRIPDSGGSIPGLSAVTNFVTMGSLAYDLMEFVRDTKIKYSRDQELEADACAIRWLDDWGTDARTAWQVFAGVLKFSPAKKDNISYSSLHPSPDERTENIQKAMATPKKRSK